MNVIEEQASLQLSALAEVTESLQKAAIDYWLFGGWAVDFYVGSVTRLHDDVDLAIWFVATTDWHPYLYSLGQLSGLGKMRWRTTLVNCAEYGAVSLDLNPC